MELFLPALRVGQRAVTGDTALRLGRFFGTGAEFGMNLHKHYEFRLAQEKSGGTIRNLPALADPMKKYVGELQPQPR